MHFGAGETEDSQSLQVYERIHAVDRYRRVENLEAFQTVKRGKEVQVNLFGVFHPLACKANVRYTGPMEQ